MKKKFFAVILVMIIIPMLLTGCIVPVPVLPEKSDTQALTLEAPVRKTEFALNETAELKSINMTAVGVEESTGEMLFTPRDGHVFVGVKFEIENTTDDTVSISSLLQFESYIDDVKADYSLGASCVFNEGSIDGSVAAGKKLVGYVALEAPQDWKKIEVIFDEQMLKDDDVTFIINK